MLMDHWEEREKDEEVDEAVRRLWQFLYGMCGLSWVSLADVQHVFGALKTNSVSLIVCQGRCLYPLLSHSCTPNLEPVSNPGTSTTLRARTSIQQGEELSIRYTHTMDYRVNIQERLRKEWFFTCACKRCEDTTELGSYFSSLQCSCGGYFTGRTKQGDTCISALTVGDVQTSLMTILVPKELFNIKALVKVVAGISWKVREVCRWRRKRVNDGFNQQTRN